MAEAFWAVGTITVPDSTGTVSVGGLEATPAAVFFWGTNWLTWESAVTTTGCAVFRGMAAPKWDDAGTILENCAVVAPAGDAHTEENSAVYTFNTAITAPLYRASCSFTGDGFDLDFSVAASGGYQVIYAALMGSDNVGAYIGASATITPGWKAGASLLHGSWGGPVSAGSDRTQEFYGGGAYPGTGGGANWPAAGLTAYTFPTSAGAQYNIATYRNNSGIAVCQGGSFIGPFLTTQNVWALPTGGSLTNFELNFHDATNGGMVVIWDDDDSWTDSLIPAASTAGTVTVSGLSFAPGLVIGYCISDEPEGNDTGGRGAVGFSVITPDFQWSATIDGVSSYGAYQSLTHGVCDVVNGTSVHTATVELTSDGFVVTTDDDDVGPASWAWHAFGHPTEGFIPQFYRLLPGGRTAVITVPTPPVISTPEITATFTTNGTISFHGFVLLENGDQIILEDGSGFLIL